MWCILQENNFFEHKSPVESLIERFLVEMSSWVIITNWSSIENKWFKQGIKTLVLVWPELHQHMIFISVGPPCWWSLLEKVPLKDGDPSWDLQILKKQKRKILNCKQKERVLFFASCLYYCYLILSH